MNTVILVGRVGLDPVIRTTSSGTKTATISVATTETYNGEKQTEWHSIVYFGKIAELVEKYVNKGSQIGVTGKIHYDSYEKDGVKHKNTQIFGATIEFLSSKNDGNNMSSTSEPQPTRQVKQTPPVFNSAPIPEDDLPF